MPVLKHKPLSVNDAWKGRRMKTKDYKRYEQHISYLLPKENQIPEGYLTACLKWGFSSAGSDIDNPVKPFIDILQKKYGFNDNKIRKMFLQCEGTKKGEEFIEFDFKALHGDEKDFIETYTGKQFYFLDPKPEQICIADIAQALSLNCRFSGHVKKFYSVAEHSVILANLVYSKTNDKEEAFSALLHDASEAYLTDIPRPIKPHLFNYMEVERVVQSTIEKAFGAQPISELTHHLDQNILGTEAKQLYLNPPDWAEQYDEVDVQVQCWPPDMARRRFLSSFNAFKPEGDK